MQKYEIIGKSKFRLLQDNKQILLLAIHFKVKERGTISFFYNAQSRMLDSQWTGDFTSKELAYAEMKAVKEMESYGGVKI